MGEPKVDPCPDCKRGTVAHCENQHCGWLRCKRCKKFGRPGSAWLPVGPTFGESK